MNHTHTVVFSAWRSNQDLITNIEASKQARAFLDGLGLPHWDAVGAYKEEIHSEHTQEVSHVIHCRMEDVSAIEDYAFTHCDQECILLIDHSDNEASLYYPQASEVIGTIKQVNKEEAQKNGCYTYFLGEYFICK